MDEKQAIAEVSACEEQRYAAIVAADTAMLDRLLDADLIHIHSTARIDTKASYIDALATGRAKYLSARRSEASYTVKDGLVLVLSRINYEVARNGGTAQLDNRNLSVWQSQAGGWKLISTQSSKIPPA